MGQYSCLGEKNSIPGAPSCPKWLHSFIVATLLYVSLKEKDFSETNVNNLFHQPTESDRKVSLMYGHSKAALSLGFTVIYFTSRAVKAFGINQQNGLPQNSQEIQNSLKMLKTGDHTIKGSSSASTHTLLIFTYHV